jgi:DNA-directed RNA polymerase subunit RPC12/RpoP
MTFDPEQRLLVCSHCQTTKNVNEFKDEELKSEGNKEEFAGVISYKCPSCGAELVTDSYTAATTCAYCGSPNIIEERLSNNFKPNSIIPFEYNREYTLKEIKKWCHNGLFTPSDFLNKRNLDTLTGIYVPFWLYDVFTNTSMYADCKTVRVATTGDSTVTTTSKYYVRRNMDANFSRIPADASIKMEDELMDKLEPFNYYGLVDFDMSYMSGYMAEKYNYTSRELESRTKTKVERYAYDLTRDTIFGYDSVEVRECYVDSNIQAAEYAMLPAWIYNYTYKNQEYLFAMNGQTGKVAGKPPISKQKVALIFLNILIATISIIKLVIYYLGGGF